MLETTNLVKKKKTALWITIQISGYQKKSNFFFLGLAPIKRRQVHFSIRIYMKTSKTAL